MRNPSSRLPSLALCLATLAGGLALAACGERGADPGQALRNDAQPAPPAVTWARGIENQRKADLGDGSFLNPILAGDHPDPSVLRVGDDFYLTLSSFDAYPGLPLWHSRDLVNWEPIGHAITTSVGSIWAPDLVHHDGRYYIYFPGRTDAGRSNYVVWADDIHGPWSEPVDLRLPDHIDPGHAVGEDGRRYLFLSGGDYVQLADDGLSTVGEVSHAYDGWRYPEEWVVESYSQEGPKITRRGDWYYMITAVGGTAGPPTGHMVIVARSKSIHGPWENDPRNPVVRTRSRDEQWWSRGHATLVEDTAGQWWMMYHGYENGLWTLGRQALLDPVEWTDDGWFVARGGDLGRPLRKPAGEAVARHGLALSDRFDGPALGPQWAFYDPGPGEMERIRFEDGALVLQGKGENPRDASPLTAIAGDRAYELEVRMEIEPGAIGGAVMFYSDRLYAGLGSNGEDFIMHRYGEERPRRLAPGPGGPLWLRMTYRDQILTLHHSRDGKDWIRHGVQMELSGYHHNTVGRFLSLRPGLYAAGDGRVRFLDVRYRALD